MPALQLGFKNFIFIFRAAGKPLRGFRWQEHPDQICIWEQLPWLLHGEQSENGFGRAVGGLCSHPVREMLLISGSGEIIDLFIQQAVVEHLCASVLWP